MTSGGDGGPDVGDIGTNLVKHLTVDDLKAPLLAAVGAADLALERVNEIVTTLRERAGEARSDAEARVEESRARLTKLQEDLPTQFGELRERLSGDELRKVTEVYAEAAQSRYDDLVGRGEAALERLRSQPAAAELTREALGNVASQTRAVGERAAKLVGVELPKNAVAKKVPAKKVPAKKVPAKKVPAKKVPAKKVPAKKVPAKKVPAKKTAATKFREKG
jgi:heparin binding hemagglutinin HbhA